MQQVAFDLGIHSLLDLRPNVSRHSSEAPSRPQNLAIMYVFCFEALAGLCRFKVSTTLKIMAFQRILQKYHLLLMQISRRPNVYRNWVPFFLENVHHFRAVSPFHFRCTWGSLTLLFSLPRQSEHRQVIYFFMSSSAGSRPHYFSRPKNFNFKNEISNFMMFWSTIYFQELSELYDLRFIKSPAQYLP